MLLQHEKYWTSNSSRQWSKRHNDYGHTPAAMASDGENTRTKSHHFHFPMSYQALHRLAVFFFIPFSFTVLFLSFPTLQVAPILFFPCVYLLFVTCRFFIFVPSIPIFSPLSRPISIGAFFSSSTLLGRGHFRVITPTPYLGGSSNCLISWRFEPREYGRVGWRTTYYTVVTHTATSHSHDGL